MVKLYALENTIFIKDELTNGIVSIDFYFDPPKVFFNPNLFYDTYKEEISMQRKAIKIFINNEDDSDLFLLLASLIEKNKSYKWVSDSPISHYITLKKPNTLRIINDGKNIIIKLNGNRSETDTGVFLASHDPNLILFYQIINALAKHLNILNSAEIQEMMYTNYRKMMGVRNED